MKTVFSAVLLSFFLFLSQGAVLAAETNFNPSQLYQVHTIPGETKTTMGHEEKTVNPDSDSKPKTKISDLTFKAMLEKQAVEKSLWESITNYLKNSSQTVLDPVTSFIVIPAKAGIQVAGNSLEAGLTSIVSIIDYSVGLLSSSISNIIAFLSQSTYNKVSSVTYGMSQLSKTSGNHSAKVISIATAVTGLSLGVLYFGRSLFTTSVRMGMEGVVSLGDMMLRGVGLLTGSLLSLFTGKTTTQGYELSLTKIKQWFGHDVGESQHDLRILGRNLVIGVGGLLFVGAIVYGVPAITAVNATAGTLTTKVSPDVVLKTQYVLSRTANDCSLIGQCEDAIGLGITVVSNSLLGISPSTPALATLGDDALMYADDVMEEGYILSKTALKNTDDVLEETSDIAKTLTQADDVVLGFNRTDLEKRTGRDFVEEIFAEAQGKEFDVIAKKWPKSLEFLDEGKDKGHVIFKHYKKSKEFLQSRIIEEEISFASSYNSKESLLNTLESSLNNPQNKNEIVRWLNSDTTRTLTFHFESKEKIGYILEKGKDYLVNSNKAIVVLKKTDQSYYILTSYVE